MDKLSKDEWDLLGWLSREDVSAYGECNGPSLDKLVALGIAEVEPYGPGLAQGYGRVTLTDYGWELVTDMRDAVADTRDLDGMSA